MSSKLIGSWCLSDGAFFPCSIHNIGDDGKTVLIVPGEGQSFTLVIKNFRQNIETGGEPHKVSRIKSTGYNLVETVVTARNTVSRGSSGQLVVFSSFRECNVVGGIEGVKAIGTMDGGSKLTVIRVTEDNKMRLDVFADLVGCNMGSIVHSFDLTWEKNEFEVTRNRQVHKVKTVQIAKNSSKLFTRFLNCIDIAEETEIILFTMDNGLYWLKILEGSYEIVTVRMYPSIVLDYNYAHNTGCFAVLVSNAVLYIYSISEDADCLLLQEDKRYLGPIVEAHYFITELSTFIYSNGSHVIQIRYYYSELSKAILHVSKELQIVGVTGITYLDHAKMAICVTENRLFYSVPVHKLTDLNTNQQNDYFELTNEILSQANQMTCLLTNEVTVEKTIAQQINQEKVQIDVLTQAANRMYGKLITAELLYHKHLPNLHYNTLLLNDKACLSNMFVQIEIILSKGIRECINRQSNWLLQVCLDDDAIQIQLEKMNYIEDNTIRLLAPIEESTFRMHGFPRIEINAIITVTHDQDKLMLKIPIQVRNEENFASLFEASLHEPKIVNPRAKLPTEEARDLIRQCEQKPVSEAMLLEWDLRGLMEFPTIGSLLNQIGIPMNNIIVEKAFLKLGNQLCEVNQVDPHAFRFNTKSPGVLYLVKVLCNEKLRHKSKTEIEKLKAIRLQLLQCESDFQSIASFYRQIRTSFDTWR
ncbi:AAEL003691-PA [Aedes aegypti]|uniref:Uncharacterized protein n=2 Tax=Aedes aegypti TaxID=7159 RepID=Q17ET6_AEDAE|nr:uncharacterized protein LOC5578764 [Aedes aegypti]XP_021701447.1 uncharacterized protein LOC5578764 [Aedes aegypti]XP_021701448.1 uncharacterized protein LOC5578764 [Aedes aegypti]EAT45016.1 AAEL003691-PA [Aedes aegypti]